MLALLENPDQLAKLRARPAGCVADAVEEIVRWTTPVNYMMRTAARDIELGGHEDPRGRAADALLRLGQPRRGRVRRARSRSASTAHPNRHLGFGIGEHFCLGAHLARKSQRALFAEIAGGSRTSSSPASRERLASSFVAGVKHLPIRYRLAPRA